MNTNYLINQLKQQGLYRVRNYHQSIKSSHNFSSNDYLSLRNDPAISKAYQNGFALHPAGSGASMAAGGYHPIHKELEETCAAQLGVDTALLFSSGYAANLAMVMLVARLNGHFLIDKEIHASIYDGIKLGVPSYTRYLHTDLDDLRKKMIAQSNKSLIIFTESIFSMSGQEANLLEIGKLCDQYQAVCFVDEAHSFGVIGKHGLGAVMQAGLSQDIIPLRTITFGKALGFQGAVIAGKADWIDALYQCARSLIYSTAPSPSITYGLLESLKIVYDADEKRKKLSQLINYFQSRVQQFSLNWRTSNTAIQQLQLGCPYRAVNYSTELNKQGITCLPMRTPTVSHKDTGLRVVLNAHHEPENIDNLLNKLQGIYESEY